MLNTSRCLVTAYDNADSLYSSRAQWLLPLLAGDLLTSNPRWQLQMSFQLLRVYLLWQSRELVAVETSLQSRSLATAISCGSAIHNILSYFLPIHFLKFVTLDNYTFYFNWYI
jgi:hypothetical protein